MVFSQFKVNNSWIEEKYSYQFIRYFDYNLPGFSLLGSELRSLNERSKDKYYSFRLELIW